MNLSETAQHRLANQQVSQPELSTPEELAHWMGAMQAQDYEMAKWALGVRLPGSTRKDIEKAIQAGQIIRTHLLRPTWHFVAANNLRWILELSAPRIRVAARSRQKQLGITKELISKSNKVIEQALANNKAMMRKELVEHLEDTGFKNEDNKASHLLINAELDGVICSGPSLEKDYTYALFEDPVPPAQKLTKEEALAKLALTYFKSHGPATLEDFTWWSGLTKTGARKALKLAEEKLISDEIDSQTYWISEETKHPGFHEESVYLLPAYDEYLISYRDRNAAIRIEDQKRAISNNGIFRPIIVLNGEVVGIWKRTEKKNAVYVETKFFRDLSKERIEQVEEAAKKFADFLGKELNLAHLSE